MELQIRSYDRDYWHVLSLWKDGKRIRGEGYATFEGALHHAQKWAIKYGVSTLACYTGRTYTNSYKIAELQQVHRGDPL